ncbi:MAG: DUF975 family protein [Candidatus Ancillula sp.]|jgi:uncharacterized membrane protein|nr:DUF975 family protein [Candidatus Ancillula sp.]
MLNRKELKSLAKERMSGNAGMYVGFVVIYVLLISAIGIIATFLPLGGGIAAFFAHPVVIVALTIAFLKFSRGTDISPMDIFRAFNENKLFFRYWIANFRVSLFASLWSLLLVVPGIIKSIAYSFTYFILEDNPEMTVTEAQKRSIEITKGHKGELFVLILSFILWELLVLVTFGIAIIYVLPYIQTTYANAYRKIINEI